MVDEIRFYHLQKTSSEKALSKLLPTALKRYGKIIICAPQNQIKQLNRNLWGAGSDFLPHAAKGEGVKGEDDFVAQQPIWINADAENPNGAKILFSLEKLQNISQKITKSNFALICLLFQNDDEDAIGGARLTWQQYQTQIKAGKNITARYYREDNDGHWQEQKLPNQKIPEPEKL